MVIRSERVGSVRGGEAYAKVHRELMGSEGCRDGNSKKAQIQQLQRIEVRAGPLACE